MAEQDALAEQVGIRAAEHLPFEHFDAVDVAFDGAAVPGQAQTGGDRVLVTAHSADEGVQCGLVIGGDGGHPAFEVWAA